MIIMSLILFAGVSAISAQEQESKLVDRLLRPNMSLVNSAQDKQFGAASTYATRNAPSKSVYLPERRIEKSFTARSAYSSKQLSARHFRGESDVANIATRSQPTHETVPVSSAADSTRVAPESAQRLSTVAYPGNRPFLGQGKSQKALSARDTPLTIEQVRELLNKNK